MMCEFLEKLKPTYCDDCDVAYSICDTATEYCQKDMINAYQQGRADAEKELQEQIPKWHMIADNDFPTNDDNRFYMCISENHEEDIPTMFQYDSELGFGWWHDVYDTHTLGFVDSEFRTVEEEHLEKVIAWMELPTFKK